MSKYGIYIRDLIDVFKIECILFAFQNNLLNVVKKISINLLVKCQTHLQNNGIVGIVYVIVK